MKYGIKKKRAMKIATIMLETDPDLDPDELKINFDEEETRESFCEYLKGDFGITLKTDQNMIIKALNDCPKVVDEKQYLIGYFAGEKLHHINEEKQNICKHLARANLKATIDQMGPIGMGIEQVPQPGMDVTTAWKDHTKVPCGGAM